MSAERGREQSACPGDRFPWNCCSEHLTAARDAARSGREQTVVCPFCGHDLDHHDQPDCWDCTNSGTYCDSEVRDD